MSRLSQSWRRFGTIASVLALALFPAAAKADPGSYLSPIFGITTAPGDMLLVADWGQGIVDGDTGDLVADLPRVTDVAARSTGGLWATTSGLEAGGHQKLFWIDPDGNPVEVADLGVFESMHNPHPAAVDSNPFDVADNGRRGALVADAGGNDLLAVNDGNNPHSNVSSRVKVVAVLPNEVVSTANIKGLVGCPAGPPNICSLPPMIPAEPVATSIAIGPDGAYYVGELKGFPAPVGESRVWRIDPTARNARCGESAFCSVAFDGFTSIIDLAFGPDGRLYVAQLDDASWFAVEVGVGVGGSVHACDLATGSCEEVMSGVPILTSIAFRDGSLWGSTLALVPGAADVVPLP